MDKPILFLDSGIGGIPYCMDFLKRNPQESVFYLADRENFPYGPRKKEDIVSILTGLTKILLKLAEPKMAVLACNTASLSALSALRQSFPSLPFVGTVPAIKPAANACKSGRIGVLGTERTIEDIRSFYATTDETCEIFGVAAPQLVEFVEQCFEAASEKEKMNIVKKYVEIFLNEKIDTLVLGCTHFLYLQEEFRLAASPFIEIFDSLDGITKRIEYLLDENACFLRAGKDCIPVNRLVLTGEDPPDSLWESRASTLGFNLLTLKEI